MNQERILLWGTEHTFQYSVERDTSEPGNWPWFIVQVSTADASLQQECGASFSFRINGAKQVLLPVPAIHHSLKSMVVNKILFREASIFNGG